jgi:hypothetical protein
LKYVQLWNENKYVDFGTCNVIVNSVSLAHIAHVFQLRLTDNSFDYMFCMISTMSTIQQKAQTTLWYTKCDPLFEFNMNFDMIIM